MNKLPEIGKEYKDKNSDRVITTFIGFYGDKLVHAQHYLNNKKEIIVTSSVAYFCDIKEFWECFEELPNQEPTTEESSTKDF